jgi:hypothetical protein
MSDMPIFQPPMPEPESPMPEPPMPEPMPIFQPEQQMPDPMPIFQPEPPMEPDTPIFQPEQPTPEEDPQPVFQQVSPDVPIASSATPMELPIPMTPTDPSLNPTDIDPGTFEFPRIPDETPLSPDFGATAVSEVEAGSDVAAGAATGVGSDMGLVGTAASAAGGAAIAGGLAVGALGPVAVGYALAHSEDVAQRSDPDEVSLPGGAPLQTGSSGDTEAEPIQFPTDQTPVPADDPITEEPMSAPTNQSYAPASDPSSEPAQLPGQPNIGPVQAGGADASSDPEAEPGPGQWFHDFAYDNMSSEAADYQARATGAPVGQGYYVNGVQFDGYSDGTLLDAKYFPEDGRFLNDPDYQVKKGWGLLKQAREQIAAAGSTPIEWRVASEPAAQLISQLFANNGINQSEITVRFLR